MCSDAASSADGVKFHPGCEDEPTRWGTGACALACVALAADVLIGGPPTMVAPSPKFTREGGVPGSDGTAVASPIKLRTGSWSNADTSWSSCSPGGSEPGNAPL